MDAARKIWTDIGSDERAERARAAKDGPAGDGSLEKVLRFAAPARDGEGERERGELPTMRDMANAVNLVHGAAQCIRAAEDRARDAESRNQAIMQRATEELKAAEARVQAAEARVRAADTRAGEAEGRAKDAEAWLRQIFSTISEELPERS